MVAAHIIRITLSQHVTLTSLPPSSLVHTSSHALPPLPVVSGGAAHLPGMVAAMTPLPVIGVPVKPAGAHLDGLDALLSIVQMPKGVPVATVAIGNAANAGLLAVRILATQGAAACYCLAS